MKRLFSAAEHTGDPSSLTGSGLARICCPAGHLCCQLSDCQGRVVAFQCLSTWFFSHLLLWWPVCLIRGHILPIYYVRRLFWPVETFLGLQLTLLSLAAPAAGPVVVGGRRCPLEECGHC